jgi:hypothetical protein
MTRLGDPRPFDPDLSPEHPDNRETARRQSLTYDPRHQVYRDSDGCPTRDKFGQPLG